jgi:hypothetical protein
VKKKKKHVQGMKTLPVIKKGRMRAKLRRDQSPPPPGSGAARPPPSASRRRRRWGRWERLPLHLQLRLGRRRRLISIFKGIFFIDFYFLYIIFFN